MLLVAVADEVVEKDAEIRRRILDAGAARGRAVHLGPLADQRPGDVTQRQQRERRHVGAQPGDVTVAAVDRKLLRESVDGHADALPRQNDRRRRAEYEQVFDDCFQRVPAETDKPRLTGSA